MVHLLNLELGLFCDKVRTVLVLTVLHCWLLRTWLGILTGIICFIGVAAFSHAL